MYNRYIPQPDGTYRRSRMPEPRHGPPQKPSEPQQSCPPPPQPAPEPPKQPQTQPRRQQCPRQSPHRPNQHEQVDTSASGFLRKLLPKNFDTSDLMIVLLLLLMAGDCPDDQNTALLTLALYFIM